MDLKNTPPALEGIIGTGSGLINPNSEDFQLLREGVLEHSRRMDSKERMLMRVQSLIYRMGSYLDENIPGEVIPVGVFLKEMVEIIGVKHKEFAEYIGYKSANLSALYNGSRKINYDLALKLGAIFSMNPATWLNIQSKAELMKIQAENNTDYDQYHLNNLLQSAG